MKNILNQSAMPYDMQNDDGVHLAVIASAAPLDVNRVLSAEVDADGRSEFVWVTLANGDLMLATFPQGAMYENITS